MSKTIKNVFDEHLTFEALLNAHQRSLKNKTYKKEVLIFNMDLETNLCNIFYKLKNNKYEIGSYKSFTIFEPKERVVKSLPFVDRIIQQWYIYEFIKPYVYKRFIADTCACIDNKGTHYAVKKVERYMRLMKRKYHQYYILKGDIKKFFYSIDKTILFNIMKEIISDKKVLNLTYKFIYDSEETGIPIGNYTSQYFANIYLSVLDYYAKQELKVKYYVRYMDDFIILVDKKETAKELKNNIEEFLLKRLNLSLNAKSRYYPNKMGVNFCGYRIYETHRLLRKRTKENIKKRVALWNKLSESNCLDRNQRLIEWNSFKAHAMHANSYTYRLKMYNKIITEDKIDLKIN